MSALPFFVGGNKIWSRRKIFKTVFSSSKMCQQQSGTIRWVLGGLDIGGYFSDVREIISEIINLISSIIIPTFLCEPPAGYKQFLLTRSFSPAPFLTHEFRTVMVFLSHPKHLVIINISGHQPPGGRGLQA